METKKKALGKGLEQLFANNVIDFDNFEKEIVEDAKNDGRIEGKIEGKVEKLIEQISKKLVKGKSVAEIADALEESEEYIRELMEKYDLYAKLLFKDFINQIKKVTRN